MNIRPRSFTRATMLFPPLPRLYRLPSSYFPNTIGPYLRSCGAVLRAHVHQCCLCLRQYCYFSITTVLNASVTPIVEKITETAPLQTNERYFIKAHILLWHIGAPGTRAILDSQTAMRSTFILLQFVHTVSLTIQSLLPIICRSFLPHPSVRLLSKWHVAVHPSIGIPFTVRDCGRCRPNKDS